MEALKLKSGDRWLSVAPMMDWTDRHCRHFHGLIAPDALLFTEMVTAEAIIHGDRDRLLAQAPETIAAGRRVALQLGGSDPDRLARATETCRWLWLCRDQSECGMPVRPGAVRPVWRLSDG